MRKLYFKKRIENRVLPAKSLRCFISIFCFALFTVPSPQPKRSNETLPLPPDDSSYALYFLNLLPRCLQHSRPVQVVELE